MAKIIVTKEKLTRYDSKAKARLLKLVADAAYNSENKTIELKNSAGTVLASIDATAFIKDGMLDKAEVKNGNLVLTFNTDSGKDPISIPVSQVFNAENYYTKTDADDKFVEKETGKGLSANDFTDTLKSKLDGVAEGAQVNVLESVKVNGTAQTITEKGIDITVPTKVSDLENDVYEEMSDAEVDALFEGE